MTDSHKARTTSGGPVTSTGQAIWKADWPTEALSHSSHEYHDLRLEYWTGLPQVQGGISHCSICSVTECRPFLACYRLNRGAEMLRDFSPLSTTWHAVSAGRAMLDSRHATRPNPTPTRSAAVPRGDPNTTGGAKPTQLPIPGIARPRRTTVLILRQASRPIADSDHRSWGCGSQFRQRMPPDFDFLWPSPAHIRRCRVPAGSVDSACRP
jgi:hypothetical protein